MALEIATSRRKMAKEVKAGIHVKLSPTKRDFLNNINLNKLVTQINSCHGIPIQLEVGHDLHITCSLSEQLLEAETILQELLYQSVYPIDVNRFEEYEWQILIRWINCIFKNSNKKVMANIFQNGDTGCFEIVLVGFKDFFACVESKILDFVNGLKWKTESLSVSSKELLLMRNLQSAKAISPFQVEIEVQFDLKDPALLLHGPSKNIARTKELVVQFIQLKSTPTVPLETNQGNFTLSIFKRDSGYFYQHVDMLICPLKDKSCSNISNTSSSTESESFRVQRWVRPAIDISIHNEVSPVGKWQCIVTLSTLCVSSCFSTDVRLDGIEMCFMQALYNTLCYSEKQKYSSLAILSPKMIDHFLSEADYTRIVAGVLQQYSQEHPSTSLKNVFFISEEDSVLSTMLSQCHKIWGSFGSPLFNTSPEIRVGKKIKVEVKETGLISQEEVHDLVVLIPMDQYMTPAIDLQSVLGTDGGALDCLCEMIPTMPELISGKPVVLPVKPYTKLSMQYLILMGFPIRDGDNERNEKELASTAQRCLEICDRSLIEMAALCIPDLAQWGFSTCDTRRVVYVECAKFERQHQNTMINKVRLLQPSATPSLVTMETEMPLENLGRVVAEEPLFIKYLLEYIPAQADINRTIEPFGGKMSVCPDSQTLLIVPLKPGKILKPAVITWRETMRAALDVAHREYMGDEIDTVLAGFLHNDRHTLLDRFRSIKVFNQTTIMGLQHDVKELLGALNEIAFQNEIIKKGWKILNLSLSFIIVEYLRRNSARRFPRLEIHIDDALSIVLFEGPREEVLAAEEKCSELLNGLLYCDIMLADLQDSFLKSIDLDVFNKEVFFSGGKLAGLLCKDGELKVFAIDHDDLCRTTDLLKNTIQEYHIDVSVPAQRAIHSVQMAHFIDQLQRELNMGEIMRVNILTFQDGNHPHRITVVGLGERALEAKESLENHLNLIDKEIFSIRTPGAWSYLDNEGRMYLENNARAFNCVAEIQPKGKCSPAIYDCPDSLLQHPMSISSIKVYSIVVNSPQDVTKGILVCPLAYDMDLKSNPFSCAVLALAGDGIKQNRNFLPPKEVMEYTPSGGICPTIYFVNFLPYNDLLGQASEVYRANVRCCLEKCQTSGEHCITFPIIGSEGYEYPLKEEIKWLLEEILTFTQETDNIALKHVQVALPGGDGESTSVLIQEILTVNGKLKPHLLGDIKNTCRCVEVHITGWPEDRETLKQEIIHTVHGNTSQAVLHHDCLFALTDRDLSGTLEGMRNQGVLIREGKKLQILGVTSFVNEASSRLKDLLSEKSLSKQTAEEMFLLVQWEYFDNGGYVSFSLKANLAIETAYQKDENQLHFDLHGKKVQLSLDKLEGTLEGDHQKLQIRRVRKDAEILKKYLCKINYDDSPRNWQDQFIEIPPTVSLQRKDQEKIQDWGKTSGVYITLHKDGKEIRLQGREWDVLELSIKIERFLLDLLQRHFQEIKETNVCLRVQWIYRLGVTNYLIDDKTNCLLEDSYYKYAQSAGSANNFHVTLNGQSAMVDYSKMDATFQGTKTTVRLMRVDISSDILKNHLSKRNDDDSPRTWQDQFITIPSIASLQEQDHEMILGWGKTARVNITIQKDEKQIRLQGREWDVLELSIKIERFLLDLLQTHCQEIKETNVCLLVQWIYKLGVTNHLIDDKSNCLLEDSYYKYVQSDGSANSVHVTLNGQSAVVDYSKMDAIFQGTKTAVRLMRVDISSDILKNHLSKRNDDDSPRTWQDQFIKIPSIASLQEKDQEIILGWGKTSRVNITIQKDEKQIRLQGREWDVLELSIKIERFLLDLLQTHCQEIKETNVCLRVQWIYKLGVTNHLIDDKTNCLLEDSYYKYVQSDGSANSVHVTLNGQSAMVDYSKMDATFQGTKTAVRLMRVDISSYILKNHLSKTNDDGSLRSWQDQFIQIPSIASLQEEDQEMLLAWGKTSRVHITFHKDGKEIHLQGREWDVLELSLKIERFLVDVLQTCCQEIKETNVCLRVQWLYKLGGTNHLLDEKTNCLLEDSYYKYVQSAGAANSVHVTLTGQSATVDYSKMDATFQGTKKAVKLTRVDISSGIDLPLDWDMMNGKILLAVPLLSTSEKYRSVCNNFNKTVTGYEIIRIERIQNSYLHTVYEQRKKFFTQKNRAAFVNEMTLFHGTASSSCDSINFKGFNRSYTANGKVYGEGVYFAVKASYSVDYSKPDPKTQLRYMYQAKVIAGRYTQGHSTMKVAPSRPGNNADDVYDSVVDNPCNPSMYIVFHDNQAYPEYLITFK